MPREPGPARGISYTLSQYERPRSEKQSKRIVGVRDEQPVDEVLLLGAGGHSPSSATPLRPVLAEGTRFHVVLVGQGHHHVLRGDQVLPVEAAERSLDDGAARIVPVPGADVHELLADHREEPIGIFQNLDKVS